MPFRKNVNKYNQITTYTIINDADNNNDKQFNTNI